MNINKKILNRILTLLMVFLSLTVFGCTKIDNNIKSFDIHTELQNKYLLGDETTATLYAKGNEELSLPNPIELTWEGESKQYIVFLSFDEDFNDAKKYETSTNSILLYNLFIKKLYYYKVISDDEIVITDKFIIDCDGPRNLYIDGITNARDLGGWLISDSEIVKQGYLYRTSKFNEDESTNLVISEVGIATLVNDFNIKSEIDLRTSDDNENGGLTNSVLGESVNYYNVPMVSNGNILLLNKEVMVDLFNILGDINNYPIVFHCSIGTDRTGFVSFMILSLLDVNKKNIYQDYAFSNFGLIYNMRQTSVVDNYIKTLKSNYEGETLKELVTNYLLDCGVSIDNINNVIDIMKEEYGN